MLKEVEKLLVSSNTRDVTISKSCEGKDKTLNVPICTKKSPFITINHTCFVTCVLPAVPALASVSYRAKTCLLLAVSSVHEEEPEDLWSPETEENTGPPAVKPSRMSCEYKFLPVCDIQHLRVTKLDLVLHLKYESAAKYIKGKGW